MSTKYDNPITDYWLQNYVDPANHMCTLCGQSGIIHTEGIRTPAGVEVGRANYCICPNGQAMREQSGSLTMREADLPKAECPACGQSFADGHPLRCRFS